MDIVIQRFDHNGDAVWSKVLGMPDQSEGVGDVVATDRGIYFSYDEPLGAWLLHRVIEEGQR